jgi:guanylate kinase
LQQDSRGADKAKSRPGNLLVLSGPSGVGKGTILERALGTITGIKRCVTATTRAMRPGEKQGVDYHFCSAEEFQKLIDEERLLEWAEFAGARYGTPKQWVEEQLKSGIDVVLEIEVQGARQVAERFFSATLIFVMPPSIEALEERLRSRGTESDEKIHQRLEIARQEIAERPWFHYEIVNDKIEVAVDSLVHIIYAQRCKIDG